MEKNLEIFIAYAHKDEVLRKRLEIHLSMLKRHNLIDVWHDQIISAGTEWEREIKTHLDRSQLILLLISPDFIASNYCYCIEMNRAVERHERGEARVIPIILRPVSWQDAPFGKFQALPTGAKPITMWQNRDEAFLNIAEGIRKAVEELAIKGSQLISSSHAFSDRVVPIGLPRPATLIGRDDYLQKLIARLRTGETSGIYSLNGMGGIGKTAVAAEIVAQLFQDSTAFPGGAAWIPCEDLTGSEGLSEIWKRISLAIQLHMVTSDTHSQGIAVANALARRPRLLIALDNIEP